MQLSVKHLFIVVISSLLALAPANAVSVSYGQTLMTGLGHTGRTVPLAEAQTVTVEAKLDSPGEVERAVEITNQLIKGTPSDHVSLIETTSEESPLSPEVESVLERLRAKVDPDRRASFPLSKQTLTALVRKAKAAGFKIGKSAADAVRDPHKLTLMTVRFVSASGATFVGVSLAAKLPVNVMGYWNMLGATWQTGAMSAAMVMFVDAYSDLIVNPGFLSRHVDESKWMKTVVGHFRTFGKNSKKKASAESLPIKFGLYTDQILKSLSLEFAFVFGSTWATAGFLPAAERLPHVLEGALNGGLGQTFFDQAIAILARAREASIHDYFPAGEAREAAIKKLDRHRNLAMAANSIAQVWMVMVATRGSVFATSALHFYLASGLIVRAAVIPIENRLNRAELAKNPTVQRVRRELTDPRNVISPLLRPLRCEAIFRVSS